MTWLEVARAAGMDDESIVALVSFAMRSDSVSLRSAAT